MFFFKYYISIIIQYVEVTGSCQDLYVNITCPERVVRWSSNLFFKFVFSDYIVKRMELPDVPFNKSEYIETASGNRNNQIQ